MEVHSTHRGARLQLPTTAPSAHCLSCAGPCSMHAAASPPVATVYSTPLTVGVVRLNTTHTRHTRHEQQHASVSRGHAAVPCSAPPAPLSSPVPCDDPGSE